jgi:enoyl-CoA hydratase/carnithine racemase
VPQVPEKEAFFLERRGGGAAEAAMSIRVDGAGSSVVTLTLDRPERGNALTPRMMREMAQTLAGLAAEGGVRALILRGSGGRVFCSGYDLAELPGAAAGPASGGAGAAAAAGGASATGAATAGNWAERFPELTAMVRSLCDFPAPTLACVNGHAIGGGALLASLCDLRWAQEGARFQVPAVRLGVLYPLEGIRRMVALLGAARASRIFLLAEELSADEGARCGLWQELAPAEALEAKVRRAADALAAAAPLSVAGLRALLREVAEGASDATKVEALHADWTARCMESEDLKEAVAAMREKRPPRFQGR